MFTNLTLAYPWALILLVPVVLVTAVLVYFFAKAPCYVYPLVGQLAKGQYAKSWHREIVQGLRTLSLLLLAFLIARPQWVEEHSHVIIDGVAIMMALDVSGSMELFDDLKDQTPRLEVLKDEALKFIQKRVDDPIGIVLFGSDVLTRCPLTLDKTILKNIVSSIKLGMIDPNGTSLGTALAKAVDRVREANAKSKIVVLLTDGVPKGDEISPDIAIELAKSFGIKIYTVGIGRQGGGFMRGPFGRPRQAQDSIDMALLKKIANETGGKAFRAESKKDMEAIYNTIDELEKSKQDSEIFNYYYEAFCMFVWVLLALLALELFLTLYLWRGLW